MLLGIVFCWPHLAHQSTISAVTIIALTNAKLGQEGLLPLKANAQLTIAAQRKAEDMITKDYFSHNGPGDATPWKFILEAGYDYWRAGENLAIHFADSEPLFEAWMNSPDHKANIINHEYEDIGIGIVTGEFEDQNTTIVVQMFGAKEDSKKLPLDEEVEGLNTEGQDVRATDDYFLPIPSPPIITKPDDETITSKHKITVAGISPGDTKVTIFQNDQIVDQISTDRGGHFNSLIYLNEDGEFIISTAALSDEGLSSDFSKEVKVIKDTTAPKIITDGSFFLPAYLRGLDGYDLFIKVKNDPATVKVTWGEIGIELDDHEEDIYSGTIMKHSHDFLPRSFQISAKDRAKNIERVKIIR